jgi:biopolymer transport protein ExbD
MGKVKIPRKSVSLDMTAMCDMAFLLLNFFILTAKFKPEDPVTVQTPGSVSDAKMEDKDVMTITVDPEGRVFFGVTGQFVRAEMFQNFAKQHGLQPTQKDVDQFSLMETFGVPAAQLPALLKLTPPERNKPGLQPGIPIDSVGNELKDWVSYARYANTSEKQRKGETDMGMKIAIRGDVGTPYPVVKRVIAILQEQNLNRINLITNMEAKPAGM